MQDLINSLQKFLEKDDMVFVWFEDKHVSLSMLVNSYDVNLLTESIDIEFGWTNISVCLSNIVKAKQNDVLDGYDLIGEDWEMCIHTSSAV